MVLLANQEKSTFTPLHTSDIFKTISFLSSTRLSQPKTMSEAISRMRCYPISSFESDFITKLVGEFFSDLVVSFLSLDTTKNPGLNLLFCAFLREHERHELMVRQLKNLKTKQLNY